MAEDNKQQDVRQPDVDVKDNVDNSVDKKEPPVKTFTQEEVDKMIKDRLERQRKKDDAKRAEAEKLAKMNEQEKSNYELDKWKEKAESAQRQLDALNMRSEARKMLADKGIQASEEELDLVVSSNADATASNIERLYAVVEATKEAQRKELLQGRTPQSHGKPSMSRDEIMAIKDPIARRKAIAENIGTFKN